MKASGTRTHMRNLLFNWGGHATTLLVMFFLSPYVVGKLDAVSYGIWSLLIVFTGYMGLFDLGVRASVGRHIALYLGKEDMKGVDETIRAGLGFFSIAGVGIFLLSLILGYLFPHFFRNVPAEYHATIRILLPLMVINIWLTAIGAIFSSILSAYERFDVARAVDIGGLLIRTAGTVYVLSIGWDLWGMVGAIIASKAFIVYGSFYCARIYYKELRGWPPFYSKNRLKELLDYGLAASISSAATQIIGKTDLVLAGVLLAVASVREYNVGYVVPSYSATFVLLISRTLFPSLQKSVAQNNTADVRLIFSRQLRMVLCFGIPVYIGMAVYAKPFIHLWMFQEGFGENSVDISAGIMTVLALANLPLLFIRPSISLLAASGLMRFNAVITIIEACVNLGFSTFFVLKMDWGLLGIAAGTLIARLLTSTFLIPVYQYRKLSLGTGKPHFWICIRAVVSGIIFACYCTFTIRFMYPDDWLSLFIHVGFGVVVWACIGLPLLAPRGFFSYFLAIPRKFVRF